MGSIIWFSSVDRSPGARSRDVFATVHWTNHNKSMSGCGQEALTSARLDADVVFGHAIWSRDHIDHAAAAQIAAHGNEAVNTRARLFIRVK